MQDVEQACRKPLHVAEAFLHLAEVELGDRLRRHLRLEAAHVGVCCLDLRKQMVVLPDEVPIDGLLDLLEIGEPIADGLSNL